MHVDVKNILQQALSEEEISFILCRGHRDLYSPINGKSFLSLSFYHGGKRGRVINQGSSLSKKSYQVRESDCYLTITRIVFVLQRQA